LANDVEEAILPADRICLIGAGHVTQVFEIAVPRPRERDAEAFVGLWRKCFPSSASSMANTISQTVEPCDWRREADRRTPRLFHAAGRREELSASE